MHQCFQFKQTNLNHAVAAEDDTKVNLNDVYMYFSLFIGPKNPASRINANTLSPQSKTIKTKALHGRAFPSYGGQLLNIVA